MYKKIHLFINGKYICTSNRYRTCKEFKNTVLSIGVIEWVSVNGAHRLEVKDGDKIVCSFKC